MRFSVVPGTAFTIIVSNKEGFPIGPDTTFLCVSYNGQSIPRNLLRDAGIKVPGKVHQLTDELAFTCSMTMGI